MTKGHIRLPISIIYTNTTK